MSEHGARTHDYTVRTWGHDFGVRSLDRDTGDVRAYGWGEGVRSGDYLIFPITRRLDGTRSTTRYRVESIRYMRDPRDQWFAELRFAPRQQEAAMTKDELWDWAMRQAEEAARLRDFAAGLMAAHAGVTDAGCAPPGSAEESDWCEGVREGHLRLGQAEPPGRVAHGAVVEAAS